MTELEKSQKLKKKKTGKRCYKAFIHNVSWWYDGINFELDNSYIQKRVETITYPNGKTAKVITLPLLPRWNDTTRIQKVAYFAKFLAKTREFSNLKLFTLDFTCTQQNKCKNKRLTTIKDNYAKKMYNNFRYHLGKDNIEIVYIVEGKKKRIHVHGYIDVSRLEGQQYILKQSASTYKNEYSQSQYRNMLQIKDGYNEYKGGSYGWFRYMNKGNHSENGLYFSRALLERVRENYQALYKQYKKIIQQLKADNIKITYKQDTPEERA